MTPPRTVPLVMLLLVVACGDRDAAPPASERAAEPTADARPGETREATERPAGRAEEALRRAGEQIDIAGEKTADAVQRADERVRSTIETTEVETAEERQRFETWARGEIERIDQSLEQLDARGKAADESARANLRAARDRAKQRLDELDEETGETWTRAKREVERDLKKLRGELETRRSS